jgi:hypothetical protein
MSIVVNSSDAHKRMPTTPGATARVQVLGDMPVMPVETQLLGREDSALYLKSPCSFKQGAAVRIDVNGGLVLGEVAACEDTDEGRLVSVRIDHVIPSVSDLAKLVDRVMCESQPPRVTSAARAVRA